MISADQWRQWPHADLLWRVGDHSCVLSDHYWKPLEFWWTCWFCWVVNRGKSINSWHFSSCFLGICQGFCFRIQEMWNDWQLLMAECWGLQGCWKKQTCESPAQLVVMLQCQCLLLSRWFGRAVLMETHWDPADLIWILCVIDTSVNWVYLGMTWSGSSSKFSKRARFSQVLPHGHH